MKTPFPPAPFPPAPFRPVTDLTPLRAALSSPSSALVALDFDGTLAPISPHPDDARPVPGVHKLLRDIRVTGAALAVVTGRSSLSPG